MHGHDLAVSAKRDTHTFFSVIYSVKFGRYKCKCMRLNTGKRRRIILQDCIRDIHWTIVSCIVITKTFFLLLYI